MVVREIFTAYKNVQTQSCTPKYIPTFEQRYSGYIIRLKLFNIIKDSHQSHYSTVQAFSQT